MYNCAANSSELFFSFCINLSALGSVDCQLLERKKKKKSPCLYPQINAVRRVAVQVSAQTIIIQHGLSPEHPKRQKSSIAIFQENDLHNKCGDGILHSLNRKYVRIPDPKHYYEFLNTPHSFRYSGLDLE